MATTSEILVGGIILFTNTLAVVISYYVTNVTLSPLLDILASWGIHPALQQSLWELTYIFSANFAFILILWLMSVVGFVYILARRQVSPFEY